MVTEREILRAVGKVIKRKVKLKCLLVTEPPVLPHLVVTRPLHANQLVHYIHFNIDDGFLEMWTNQAPGMVVAGNTRRIIFELADPKMFKRVLEAVRNYFDENTA